MNNTDTTLRDDDYSDIINLPAHVSTTRRPMSMEARAAQFAPFAALDGFEKSIGEAKNPLPSE